MRNKEVKSRLAVASFVFNIEGRPLVTFLSNIYRLTSYINYLLNAPTTYYANGKLLLSGEYFVLHGAKALALPLNVGQRLTVQQRSDISHLHWKASYNENVWFECVLNAMDFKVISASDQQKATILSRIFTTIGQLNPALQPLPGTDFATHLDADPQWGFGSSSTLISLLSQWARIDPFQLNELIFQGSGFDIACAMAKGPILYQKNQPIQPVQLDYPFIEKLYLVYSGNKKSTLPEVRSFLENIKVTEDMTDRMSALSEAFVHCRDQHSFHRLIRQHEAMVGNLIGQKPVKERLFTDFEGEVKSLGAWGGDYYLFSSLKSDTDTKIYFENKGLSVIFRWTELIKS